MAIPVQSYRKWAKVLTHGGAVFEGRDGLNHPIWSYTPPGLPGPLTFSLPAHSEGDDVKPVYIQKLRRLWRLSPANGVSDHDFLEGNWPR